MGVVPKVAIKVNSKFKRIGIRFASCMISVKCSIVQLTEINILRNKIETVGK
jgi:hypothetical protein